jgi:NTE family protein
MTEAASTTTFAVVFTLFAVAALVLIVLTLRYVVGLASASRAKWLAEQEGGSTPDADVDDGDQEEEVREMTALVLGGGSSRGAIQIGMLQVLTEHGFIPDRIFGSSVGAINGVGFAADPTREGVERMTQVWLRIRREDIYPQGRLHGPWLYFQQRDAVYVNSGLRAIIEEGFPHDRLEDAVVPVEVVATSLFDGGERWFTYGSAVDAVLASAAMPAIFPPVEIDGEKYIDGGVVDNVPIQRAIDAGATRIVVLLCAPPVYQPPVSRRPVEGMVNALFIAIHSRFVRDMAHLPEDVEVILCVGPEGTTRDFDDFSTTEHLIALGRAEASEVVRRYSLGTIAYPAPPMPVPAVRLDADELTEERSGIERRSGDRRSTIAETAAGQSSEGGFTDDIDAVPEPLARAVPDPVTQPDPGT